MRQLHAVAVGPQKTATTWLHRALSSRRECALPKRVKETFFFDRQYERGWEWYWRQFPEIAPGARAMEVSPSYFATPVARDRIAEHNSACRIVVTLRHPVERTFSHYLHRCRKEGWRESFETVARRDPSIVSSSHYREHLSGWIDTFGRERVLILLQEDIGSRPGAVFETLCGFLGIKKANAPDTLNERVYGRSLPRSFLLARMATAVARWLRERDLHSVVEGFKALGAGAVYAGGDDRIEEFAQDIRNQLLERYEEDVRYVEGLTGRSLEEWRC